MAELNLKTSACAVDTWAGDVHTGRYSNAVFSRVERYNQEHYGDFSRLLRLSFDSALAQFADESIDILHIDGSHSYASAKDDFEKWIPKVRPGGVILLHDIAVVAEGFGVHELWHELEKAYPTFSFRHSCGLGVVLKPGQPPSTGIGATMFGSQVFDPGAIRLYYELCDDRMRFRHTNAAQKDGGEVGLWTQLFWRSPESTFSESRSVRLYSSLLGCPATILLDLPRQSDPVSEIRIDFSSGRSLFELQSLAILNPAGEPLWALDAAEALNIVTFVGISSMREGKHLILDLPKEGGHLLLTVPSSIATAIRDCVWVELHMCAFNLESRIRNLVSGRFAADSEASSSTTGGSCTELSEVLQYEEALGIAERNLAERDAVIVALREGLAHAEKLATSRLGESRQSAEALEDAQRIVVARDSKIATLSSALQTSERLASARLEEIRLHEEARDAGERISAAFSETLRVSERLAATQLEHLRQHEEARVMAQQLLRQRDGEILALTEALRDAERIARKHLEECRAHDEMLAATQRLVRERDRTIAAMTDALGGAEQLATTQLEELRRTEETLGDTQQLVAAQEGRIAELTDALGGAEQLATTQLEELRRTDDTLGETQQLVAAQEGRIAELTDALGRAEQLAAQLSTELQTYGDALQIAQKLTAEREAQLREYDDALGHAQKLACEREERIVELDRSSAQMQTMISSVEAQVAQLEHTTLERERELCAAQGDIFSLAAEKQTLLRRIDEFEHSLSIRIARLVGRTVRR